MKIQGIIKKRFIDYSGKIWKSFPIECEWDCKSPIVNIDGKEKQITDCRSTFESARNECIFVERIIKTKRKGKR